MARYLYGKVTVRAVIVDADSEEAALTVLKNTKDMTGKVVCEHELTWGETPDRNIVLERDGVLNDFLRIMQDEIPRSSARTIIHPPWRTPENKPKGCICEEWVEKGCRCGSLSKD